MLVKSTKNRELYHHLRVAQRQNTLKNKLFLDLTFGFLYLELTTNHTKHFCVPV